MTSEIHDMFPLCPGRFFGNSARKSTGRERICNPLRNLSANPPRALKCLRFLRIARKPENVFPTAFPMFPFRPRSVPQVILSHPAFHADQRVSRCQSA